MQSVARCYLDAAAGLPLHPIAVEALAAAAEDGWADPRMMSGPARRSALLLAAAREAVADEFGVQPDEVTFVPSGTHALHLATLGAAGGRSSTQPQRLVHSAVEHSAVFAAADWHRARGGTVEVVGVDSLGRVDAEAFIATASGAAAAVLQAANHEVGTVQPVDQVSAALADSGIPLVVDATHTAVFGEIPGAAVVTADARMWGGPAGVGVLVVRRGTRWRSPYPTDEAEFGRSAGVVPVPSIVAAAAALRATRADRTSQAARLRILVDQIRSGVESAVPDTVVLGDPSRRLPHLVTFSCLYVDGESILSELDRRGFVVSSGSSCTSSALTPSHVLVAMGALSSGNIRVSLHSGTTSTEVERFLSVLPEAVESVRRQLPQATTAAVAGQVIDSRGRRCPLPVLDLARAMAGTELGSVVTVLANDPAARSDIAAWCRMRGQELLDAVGQDDGSTAFRVLRVS